MTYDQNEKKWEDTKVRKTLLINGKPLYEIGDFIDSAQAKRYQANFLNDPCLKTPSGDAYRSSTFGKGDVMNLLMQPGCSALRVYYGKDDQGRPAPMLVGVHVDGNNMTEHTLILNGSDPCPDLCHDDDGNGGDVFGSH